MVGPWPRGATIARSASGTRHPGPPRARRDRQNSAREHTPGAFEAAATRCAGRPATRADPCGIASPDPPELLGELPAQDDERHGAAADGGDEYAGRGDLASHVQAGLVG